MFGSSCRLAQERQAAAEQCLKQPEVEDKRQMLLDSLSKAGVENFTMKAAVPGTEIPGHKVGSCCHSYYLSDNAENKTSVLQQLLHRQHKNLRQVKTIEAPTL